MDDAYSEILDVLFPNHGAEAVLEAWSSFRAVHEAGDVGRLHALLEPAAISTPQGAMELFSDHITAFGRDRATGDLLTLGNLRPQHARKLFAMGMSVQVGDAMKHPPVARLAQRVMAAAGLPTYRIEARSIFSPPAAPQGYGWHFECFDNIVLHLRGHKVWQLAPSEVPHALDCAHPSDTDQFEAFALPALGRPRYYPDQWQRQRLEAAESVRMEPGSVMLVPRGTWHRTGEVGEEGTVQVVLNVAPVPWMHVLASALEARLCTRPQWRASALGLLSPGPGRRAAERRMAEMLRAVADEIDDPSGLIDALHHGLAHHRVPASGEPAARYVLDSRSALRLVDDPAAPLLRIERGAELTEVELHPHLVAPCRWLMASAGVPLSAVTVAAAHPSVGVAPVEAMLELLVEGGALQRAAS